MSWGCRICAKGGAEINKYNEKLKAKKRVFMNEKLLTAIQDKQKTTPPGCRALCALRGRSGYLAFYS